MSKELSFIQFIDRFSTEEFCSDYLFQLRYSDYQCDKCGGSRFSRIQTRPHQYYCMKCHSQISVIRKTMFENTKIPLRKWFLAIFLASRDKRGISALTLSRELDLSLPTTLAMLRKLRDLMAHRDQKYRLSGTIEIDEFFIGASGGKQGRGSAKNKVIMALSYNTVSKNRNKNEFEDGYHDSISETLPNHDDLDIIDIPMYCKMLVTKSLDSETINAFIKENIEEGSIIVTDKFKGYNRVLETGNQHKTESFQANSNRYHYLHVVISNLKSFVMGTYHGLGEEYLQSYLNEFCYRFNRRKFHGNLFERLLKLTVEED